MSLRPSAQRLLASLTSLSMLGAALIVPSTATASPDDGKRVITRHHVDSPKTFYDEATGSIQLRTEYSDGKTAEFDESVIWIGKGWERGFRGYVPTYQFTTPDNDLFDHMGLKREATYYASPANIRSSATPIWWGYGSDESFKINQYLNQMAMLDLVSVKGPGRVELFNYYEDYPAGLNQLLGSSAQSPRSSKLDFGEHTHNYTLFTKPGRYELTYRTVARQTDKELLSSKLSTLVVQVGGEAPKDTASASLKDRYSNAPAQTHSPAYTLSIAPTELNAESSAGDDKLDTIRFDAKDDSVRGTLTVLIDGYHLTDLDVVDGVASWNELMGPEASKLQAIFVPEGDAGQRWISPILSREVDEEFQVIPATVGGVETEESSFDEKVLAPVANDVVDLDLNNFEPREDITWAIAITPIEDDHYRVTLTASDPRARGVVKFRAGEGGDEYSFFVENGVGTLVLSDSDLQDRQPHIKIIPHPAVAVSAVDVTATAPIDLESDSITIATPPMVSTPLIDAPAETPEVPRVIHRCEDKILLDRGHTDLVVDREGEKLSAMIYDETGIETDDFIKRDIESVINVVSPAASVVRTQRFDNQGLDFIDAQYLDQGEKFYLLPESLGNKTSILWPGYNTMKLDMEDFSDGITWHLEPTKLPQGAQFGLYRDATLSDNTLVMINSVTKDYEEKISTASHVHMNWAFSKAGVYTLKSYFTGELNNGTNISSEPEEMTFVVGHNADEACKVLSQQSHDEQSPEDTQPGDQQPEDPQPEDPKPEDPKQEPTPVWIPIVSAISTIALTALAILQMQWLIDFLRSILHR
ncbi:choice-of-anchor M domain-containing protein [Corynebacterium sp. ES2775-CONJ]|uniref:choice-of-anchor M domain-containing protein n=1 Tax=Corynebacterium sp. ES2775-CONJ TaxID=2974029 RepID=UPI002169731D|nr:choice-of-anchor M domain-containing protein [Corynebacterium sp. ES2775-CONJ]MCS4489975.1 choice-of-anchor M domain-containing protein [Corynebacterium sp. ES2775-CONJ]